MEIQLIVGAKKYLSRCVFMLLIRFVLTNWTAFAAQLKTLNYNVLLYARPEREQEVRSPPLPLSCSVMYFANAAAVSTINVTKPHMYQPNIKVMFNRVNQH